MLIQVGVYIRNILSVLVGIKITIYKRLKQSLYIVDAEHVLQVVYINEQYKVLLRISLLVRRWQKIVLRVVVDHGLGHHLVLVPS